VAEIEALISSARGSSPYEGELLLIFTRVSSDTIRPLSFSLLRGPLAEKPPKWRINNLVWALLMQTA